MPRLGVVSPLSQSLFKKFLKEKREL
jgi:hypothetical protein